MYHPAARTGVRTRKKKTQIAAMERILSFEKVDQYFKELATKNVDIGDYCGVSAEELVQKVSSTVGFGKPKPGLVFFGYRWKLDGNQQRTSSIRTLSFSILYSGIKADHYAAQTIAKSNAEAIGLEVLSRINFQSKLPASGWLYNNFIKDSVLGEDVDLGGPEGFFGMDFHFDLKVQEPLVMDPDKWSDGSDFPC